MTEPTPTPTPTPPAPPSPPPTPARPEWAPEAHWDPAAGKLKDTFGAHYGELATFHKSHSEAAAALAARKPEDIRIEMKLPEGVKPPEGQQLKINDKDPRIPLLRNIAQKYAFSQEAVDAIVAMDGQLQIEAYNAETARLAEEDKKLGANAKARKDAVANWLTGLKDKGDLTPEEHAAMLVYAEDAAAITAFEKLIAKVNGNVAGAGNGDPPRPPPEEPKTHAARMWPGGFSAHPQQKAS